VTIISVFVVDVVNRYRDKLGEVAEGRELYSASQLQLGHAGE
jgi:hypothetical protein